MSKTGRTRIVGIKKLQKYIDGVTRDVVGRPIILAVAKAVFIIEGAAKKNAPVDRGTLRASITPTVYERTNSVKGIISSNLKYAPYQELGTRPFVPPWKPLFEWAMRKKKGNKVAAGALAAAARRAIARRGIKPLKYFQSAIEDNREKIQKIISDAIDRVIGS